MNEAIATLSTYITDLMATPSVQQFLTNLVAGEITLLTGFFWLVLAVGISIVGGAIGGILLAGKDLGYRLSAMIGGLFGPVGVIPAVLVGLAVLKLSHI